MKKKILLVGASTGGPSQIKELLSSIASLSSTIIIIQHMREEMLPFFIKDIKESLDVKVESTPVTIDFSTPSIIICSQTSVIEKKYGSFSIKQSTQREIYTPDINILFRSFSKLTENFDITVLVMTGIGGDGVLGAKVLKDKGATIFAQDEKTSPVYGMPKAAYEAGIVDEVRSFESIKTYFKGL